jgi:hypothetical protein
MDGMKTSKIPALSSYSWRRGLEYSFYNDILPRMAKLIPGCIIWSGKINT